MTRCRVILLLDLDCFYAQCERVRMGLGLDASVVLMQWNSALAVTYPARLHGIKRGDSWDSVAAKSKGTCLAVHLPIRTEDDPEPDNEIPHDVVDSYNRAFHLSDEERKHVIDNEIGLRKFQNQGKASLERYRLASVRIFQVISKTLTELVGKCYFKLERASIDELFIDVTSFCWEKENAALESGDCSLELKDTVVVGTEDNRVDLDDVELRLLVRGCEVAKMIRSAVFDTLGFTLSAGISVNKTIAKLGASYGKPNGQAVVFPCFIPKVLQETPINKVRNLGGKIGKRVQALLSPDEKTLNAAARLSLPTLSAALGPETARWVFDLCRGIDNETVKETERVLVKSVTACKSFPTSVVLSEEVQRWISLLAKDVVSRVDVDATRNSRYPKNVTIHYAVSSVKYGPRTDRSLRISYPKSTLSDKAGDIAKRAIDTLMAREGRNIFLSRLAITASDFEMAACSKHDGAMDLFLQKSGTPKDKPTVACHTTQSEATSSTVHAKSSLPTTEESDLLLAQKLQKSFDRENSLVTAIEKRRPVKKMRIDNFFQKRN